MSNYPQSSRKPLSAVIVLATGLAASTAHADIAFDPYVTYQTGSYPEGVAVGDFNADGRTDAALITSYYFDEANDYKLLPPARYATSGTYTTRPMSVVAGDFNHDGLDDIAVALNTRGIEVFLQDAGGGFQAPRLYETEFSEVIAVGDLNSDGRDDLVGVGWGGQNAGVFLQTDDGELAVPAVYSAPHGGYDDLEVGDINSDGLQDIVVMSGQSYAYDNLAILTQNAGGTFDGPVFYDLGENVNTSGVAIGDVNGDGTNDVIVTYGGNRPTSRVGVFYQNAAGLLDPVVAIDSYDVPETAVAEDIDDDSLTDLAVLHGGWMRMGTYQQLASGSLGVEALHVTPYASHYGPNGLVFGDMNGDGTKDAVIADYNYGLVVLHQSGPKADLSVSLIDTRDVIILGEGLQYILSASNAGPEEATNVTVSLALPSGVGVLSVPDACVADTGTITCATPSLLVGSSIEWSIFVTPSTAGELAVTATIDADQADPVIANNTATQTTTVNATNTPPVANAGLDQIVAVGDIVTLDASGSSDIDGWIMHYQWLQVSGPETTWTSYNRVTAQFVAPRFKGKSAELEFIVYVTDNKGAMTSDTVRITVTK